MAATFLVVHRNRHEQFVPSDMLIPRLNSEVCRTPENSGDTFDLVNSGRTSQEWAFIDQRPIIYWLDQDLVSLEHDGVVHLEARRMIAGRLGKVERGFQLWAGLNHSTGPHEIPGCWNLNFEIGHRF